MHPWRLARLRLGVLVDIVWLLPLLGCLLRDGPAPLHTAVVQAVGSAHMHHLGQLRALLLELVREWRRVVARHI